jgi:hypothetical protein
MITPDVQARIDEMATKYGLKRMDLPAELLGKPVPSGNLCPDCGSILARQSGCEGCRCGYSRCG